MISRYKKYEIITWEDYIVNTIFSFEKPKILIIDYGLNFLESFNSNVSYMIEGMFVRYVLSGG